ncbi:MAG: TIGR03943 family protein [Clostridiales bacterium]|nr:TIGR03943 family protein [Clostridiales bacterium]
MAIQQQPIPVYLICGFLDAGKTNFIAPMLSNEEFTQDERTLLLITEEGEEEYDPQALTYYNVTCHVIEDKADFNRQNLFQLQKKVRPTQIVIEYNGMWLLQELEEAFPPQWALYQIVTLIEASTFDSYAKNMASLMMEKLRNADMLIFNRVTDQLADQLRQRNLKMVNRRAEMYLEYADGDRVEDYDNGLCPFDLSKPVLELSDDEFGFWYTDCMDNMERYQGKKVKFRGMVAKSPKFPRGTFAAGRFAMVCCAQDTTFLGMLCSGPEVKSLKNREWVEITGQVELQRLPIFQGEEGPVVRTLEVKPTQPPQEELVYF